MTAIRLHHLLNVCHCPRRHQKATVIGTDSLQVYDVKVACCDSPSVTRFVTVSWLHIQEKRHARLC